MEKLSRVFVYVVKVVVFVFVAHRCGQEWFDPTVLCFYFQISKAMLKSKQRFKSRLRLKVMLIHILLQCQFTV